LAKRGLVGWYFPPNTTDIVQPVDRHLAQNFFHFKPCPK